MKNINGARDTILARAIDTSATKDSHVTENVWDDVPGSSFLSHSFLAPIYTPLSPSPFSPPSCPPRPSLLPSLAFSSAFHSSVSLSPFSHLSPLTFLPLHLLSFLSLPRFQAATSYLPFSLPCFPFHLLSPPHAPHPRHSLLTSCLTLPPSLPL